jgi:hypothetical protein
VRSQRLSAASHLEPVTQHRQQQTATDVLCQPVSVQVRARVARPGVYSAGRSTVNLPGRVETARQLSTNFFGTAQPGPQDKLRTRREKSLTLQPCLSHTHKQPRAALQQRHLAQKRRQITQQPRTPKVLQLTPRPKLMQEETHPVSHLPTTTTMAHPRRLEPLPNQHGTPSRRTRIAQLEQMALTRRPTQPKPKAKLPSNRSPSSGMLFPHP